MKKVIVLLLALVMVFTMAACSSGGGGGGTSDGGDEGGGEIVIGVSLMDMQWEYFQDMMLYSVKNKSISCRPSCFICRRPLTRLLNIWYNHFGL